MKFHSNSKRSLSDSNDNDDNDDNSNNHQANLYYSLSWFRWFIFVTLSDVIIYSSIGSHEVWPCSDKKERACLIFTTGKPLKPVRLPSVYHYNQQQWIH